MDNALILFTPDQDVAKATPPFALSLDTSEGIESMLHALHCPACRAEWLESLIYSCWPWNSTGFCCWRN
jgi:hypothetical protein